MNKTVLATVVFLKDEEGRFCLAPKKQNIHKEGSELEDTKKWNGYGGKQNQGEAILETAVRELRDESGVVGKQEDLDLVARVSFFWPGNESSEPDMIVYFFILAIFEGVPKEGSEMGKPVFFFPAEIPYDEMMPADKLFLPKIFGGEKLTWRVHLRRKTPDGSICFEDEKVEPTC